MNCTVHPESAAISYCRTCGKPMCEVCRRNVRGTFYCEECIANRLQDAMPPAGASAPIPPMPHNSHAPSPGLAAMLGFIPGVGAMYNGQFAKALIHVVVFVSIIWFTSNVSGVVGGIFIPFFVFYMVFEAYKTAHARELGLPLPDPFGLEGLFGGGAPQQPPMPPVPPMAPPPAGAPGAGEAGNPNVAGFVPGTAAPSGPDCRAVLAELSPESRESDSQRCLCRHAAARHSCAAEQCGSHRCDYFDRVGRSVPAGQHRLVAFRFQPFLAFDSDCDWYLAADPSFGTA